MKIKVLLAVILLAFAFASLAAETANVKQGKYKGIAGLFSKGTSYEMENGHVFALNLISGVFFNDEEGGFLDKSALECPAVIDAVDGYSSNDHGYCWLTDKDGDKAYYRWQGKSSSSNGGGGTFSWTGGTGKYEGITGKNTYKYTRIADTPFYWNMWEGEWLLP